ncbi:hypothetical protein BV898_03466 [Hypsibius exemplaris]|uniref:Uncharacterized protein n=1 Tax=Hypsibius exemplaris TaxID=2072580 RepID=A0A1W0X5M2_HYPEX|nr:hypothetical protein BV898_03466 [Hypsibius exemplaris]
MSDANVKSFILILLLGGAVNAMVLRPKNQPIAQARGAFPGLPGRRSGFGGSGGGSFQGGLSGYSGLADIGVNMKEINDAGSQFQGAGSQGLAEIGVNVNEFGGGNGQRQSGQGGFGDIGLGDLTSGGTNLYKEFQDIVGSVGGITGVASQNDIQNIGLNSNDFAFGPGSAKAGVDSSFSN